MSRCTSASNSSRAPRRHPWPRVQGRGGPYKHLDSAGRYCTNLRCPYFGITDRAIHALVGDGHYSTAAGPRQNRVCACCGQHVRDTYGTFRYRLQAPVELITRTLTSLCRGQRIRAAAETHGLAKNTVQAWWVRFGTRAPALWHEIAHGRVQVDVVQLDELHTIVCKKTCHLCELEAQLGELGTPWSWAAIDPVSKLLLVAQVGPRTRDQACRVIHAPFEVLAPGCVPAFSSDGLKHYWSALTAHFGHWCAAARGTRRWAVEGELLYAQGVKHYRRRRLTHVIRRVLLGTAVAWAAMAAAGTRGSINMAFVERLNLTLRQGLAALTRRSEAIAKTKRHLQWRLNAYLGHYNLVREHLNLGTSPACAAGLTDHVWSWGEVLSYRLPPAGLAGGVL